VNGIAANPHFIVTEPGVGYRLRADLAEA
jgi:hypothetical protein